MKLTWLSFFVAMAIVVMIAIVLDLPDLYSLTKPLLIITLLLYFLSASKGFPGWRVLVAAALVFSWLGDVLLLMDNMFLSGLAAFLVAHIFYVIAYYKTGAASGRINPVLLAGIVVAGLAALRVLYPGLGDMLIPVVIYSSVLLTMVILALKRKGATPAPSYLLVAIGAMLFLISDSILGISKFAFEIPAERILVMSTYITAQFLIVHGLLKHQQGHH
jgi:uncharacterized membrane protein YhhN